MSYIWTIRIVLNVVLFLRLLRLEFWKFLTRTKLKNIFVQKSLIIFYTKFYKKYTSNGIVLKFDVYYALLLQTLCLLNLEVPA